MRKVTSQKKTRIIKMYDGPQLGSCARFDLHVSSPSDLSGILSVRCEPTCVGISVGTSIVPWLRRGRPSHCRYRRRCPPRVDK